MLDQEPLDFGNRYIGPIRISTDCDLAVVPHPYVTQMRCCIAPRAILWHVQEQTRMVAQPEDRPADAIDRYVDRDGVM